MIHSIPVGGLHVVSTASSVRFHGSYWSHNTKKAKIVRNKAAIQARTSSFLVIYFLCFVLFNMNCLFGGRLRR